MVKIPFSFSAVMLGLLLVGCASTHVDQKPASSEPTANNQATDSSTGKSVAQEGSTNNTALDPLQDPNSPLAKRSIYFDFDSSAVKPEDQTLLDAHAKYLTDHKNQKMTIQGNTDERGSREYNLALGQRRADSVRSSLKNRGVSDNQLEAVSFGEEKPKNPGHDEAAWSENRRADLVYDQDK